jgi:hypothetical protein
MQQATMQTCSIIELYYPAGAGNQVYQTIKTMFDAYLGHAEDG